MHFLRKQKVQNKNTPTSDRQLIIELKIYAELTGDHKKQGIKSPCDNNLYTEYGTRFMEAAPIVEPHRTTHMNLFKKDMEDLLSD